MRYKPVNDYKMSNVISP